MLINEVQLILAEKRTSLAMMRTGIAVLALPLTIMSFLIATSKYYTIFHVLHFLIPLIVMGIVLIGLGSYLIIHSIMRMRYYDRFIHGIRQQHSILAKIIQ